MKVTVVSFAGREYTLRMSAIEIYNEKVRDLLKDGTERQNLALLDDPERGTVAEGLSEEWPQSEQHLCRLLRQIETRRTVQFTYVLHQPHSSLEDNAVAAFPYSLKPAAWTSKLVTSFLHERTHL